MKKIFLLVAVGLMAGCASVNKTNKVVAHYHTKLDPKVNYDSPIPDLLDVNQPIVRYSVKLCDVDKKNCGNALVSVWMNLHYENHFFGSDTITGEYYQSASLSEHIDTRNSMNDSYLYMDNQVFGPLTEKIITKKHQFQLLIKPGNKISIPTADGSLFELQVSDSKPDA